MSSGGASGAGAPSTIGSAGGGPASSGPPPAGLLEQWLMHEGSGDTFADSTANANTITASNITWGTGTGVTSPTFNGTTSTAVATQTAITDFDGTLPFSVSVWANVTSIDSQTVVVGTLNPADSYKGWEIEIGSNLAGAPSFYLNDGSFSTVINVYSNTALNPGTVYNVIVTYDGTQTAAGVKFYVDGILSSNTVLSDALSSSTASGIPMYVGSRENVTECFYGSMSNLQIFSGVLTSGQIAAIQTAGP